MRFAITRPGSARPIACDGPEDRPRDVAHACFDACCDRVWPADLLKLARDLTVVEVGMVTAVAADDLEQAAVATLRLPIHEADRLATGDYCPVLPGLQMAAARANRGHLLVHTPGGGHGPRCLSYAVSAACSV